MPAAKPDNPPNLAVVVPVHHEAARLRQTLAQLDAARQGEPVQVIVVDGQSTDGSAAIARDAGATVLDALRGRGPQLHAGVVHSSAEHLLFVHADARLPAGFARMVRETLADPAVAMGAFTLRIDHPGWPYRLIERGVAARVRWGLPYGDQGQFVRRAVYDAAGGFPAWPLLEDRELARRCRGLGRIVIRPEPIVTSPRRWETHGLIRTTLRHQAILLGHRCGISPHRLATWRPR